MLEDLRKAPRAFKVLVVSALVENMAFGLVIPFLSLFMLNDLKLALPLIGIVLAGYTVAGMPSTIVGGMMADKIGRKIVLVSSLGLMSVTMLMYFFVDSFEALLLVSIADSFVGYLYMPAANAMIADVIPSPDRPRAYSTLRISWNVGVIFGPVIGAIIVATYSMRLLFVFGSAILAVAFIMNVIFIRETKPKETGEKITFRKVLNVANDHPFLLLCALTGVFWFFFSQWLSVLPIYANTELGVDEAAFGLLFAVSAVMTVTMQLWVTSRMETHRRSLVLLAGHLVASVGFALVFFAVEFYTLMACIVVITLGEIVFMSIVSSIIADLAPESKRGIYMGFAGLIQTMGGSIGFLFGTWILDIMPDKAFVWLVFGGIGAASALGYPVFARIVRPEIENPRVKGSATEPLLD